MAGIALWLAKAAAIAAAKEVSIEGFKKIMDNSRTPMDPSSYEELHGRPKVSDSNSKSDEKEPGGPSGSTLETNHGTQRLITFENYDDQEILILPGLDGYFKRGHNIKFLKFTVPKFESLHKLIHILPQAEDLWIYLGCSCRVYLNRDLISKAELIRYTSRGSVLISTPPTADPAAGEYTWCVDHHPGGRGPLRRSKPELTTMEMAILELGRPTLNLTENSYK